MDGHPRVVPPAPGMVAPHTCQRCTWSSHHGDQQPDFMSEVYYTSKKYYMPPIGEADPRGAGMPLNMHPLKIILSISRGTHAVYAGGVLASSSVPSVYFTLPPLAPLKICKTHAHTRNPNLSLQLYIQGATENMAQMPPANHYHLFIPSSSASSSNCSTLAKRIRRKRKEVTQHHLMP